MSLVIGAAYYPVSEFLAVSFLDDIYTVYIEMGFMNDQLS